MTLVATPEALEQALATTIHPSIYPGGNTEMARANRSPGWLVAASLAEQIVAKHFAPALATATAEAASLRAEVEAKDRALKPFADAADAYPVSDVPRREDRRREEVIWSYGCEDKGNRREITVADIRAARTALARAATAGEGRSDG